MDKDTELEFLKDFARYCGDCGRQLRCLWTALCLHHNIDVDSAEYNELLGYLWRHVHEVTVYWKDEKSFVAYMCECF